jgi:mono/diheme cytochrome c family protein
MRALIAGLAMTGAAALLAACVSTGEPPAYAGDPAVGRQLAEENCASCHAIGLTGESPNSEAPVFRRVLSHYPPNILAKDLDDAVSVSHLKMPTFYFGEHHADDLVAYLKTIQSP